MSDTQKAQHTPSDPAAGQIDIAGILAHLPHRYPFIMVDRILSMTAGEKIVGLKNVSINEPFFQGHFPGKPIFPGVLLLEGMAQTAAILAYRSIPDVLTGKLAYFAGLDNVRFRHPVVPGDQILYSLSVLKMKPRIWKLAGQAAVAGTLVAEAELMASFL